MLRRIALAALLAVAPVALAAQDVPPAATVAPPPAAAPAPKPATVKVSLQTSAGPIVLELEKERAPATTANFLKYVDGKKLDGETFYRVMKVSPSSALIQGGVRSDARKLLPPIQHEPTSQTGLSHTDGTISMARAAPGSAQADFFIIVGEMKGLDANPAAEGDNLGFAAFGHVVEGMETVKAILDAPTDPDKGEGVMKGQMIAAPVKIISARRVN